MPKRTDFRVLKLKRMHALDRPELRRDPKPAAPTAEDIAKAIAAGKFQRIEGKRP